MGHSEAGDRLRDMSKDRLRDRSRLRGDLQKRALSSFYFLLSTDAKRSMAPCSHHHSTPTLFIKA